MTTKKTSKKAIDERYPGLVPLPDPPEVPRMQEHTHITRADQTLKTWFRHRPGTLINGKGYVCQDRTNIRRSPYPDCVVAFDVDPERITATNGYVIVEVGKPPEFVLEFASSTTGRRDYTIKRESYAAMSVGEYWRFDHSDGRYHDVALAGDRLVNEAYEPIATTAEPDGTIWAHSEALGLDLCWRSGELLFRDPATGEFLLNQQQAQDALEDAQTRIRIEQQVRQDAETRIRIEQQVRQDAETRIRELEEELRRWREEG